MSAPKRPSAVVAGPVDGLTREIGAHFSAAGYELALNPPPQGIGRASAVVYVAGAPADYGCHPREVGRYVAAILDAAVAAVGRLGEGDEEDRSIVLVAPSMGASLTAGAESISAAIGALKGLSRAWAVSLGPRAIRCNVALPGILARDVTESDHYPTIPLVAGAGGRLGTDADVADAVVYLASADGSYLSGAELDIDGGLKEHRHAFVSVLWDEGLITADHWPF